MDHTSAKVVADTISRDRRITTLELVMPDVVLAQFNKHRAFSSTAESTRATPISRAVKSVEEMPFIPDDIRVNRPGMVSEECVDEEVKAKALAIIEHHRSMSLRTVKELEELGIHKQTAGRYLHAHKYVKVLVTATEWGNFYDLRLAHDADPVIYKLAHKMISASVTSTPLEVPRRSEMFFHMPYVSATELSLYTDMECIILSVARCARVSRGKPGLGKHQRADTMLAQEVDFVLNRLAKPRHMTPFENIARPVSRSSNLCRNFKGWQSVRSVMEESGMAPDEWLTSKLQAG